MPSIFINNHIELRPFEDGSLDEIVALDANGECFFHLEQMDDNCYWARFSSTKLLPLEKDVILNFWGRIFNDKQKIELTYELEENEPSEPIGSQHKPDSDGLLKILLGALVREHGLGDVRRILSLLETSQ